MQPTALAGSETTDLREAGEQCGAEGEIGLLREEAERGRRVVQQVEDD